MSNGNRPSRAVDGSQVLDLQPLLDNTGGDLEFVRELLSGFFARLPITTAAVLAAIHARDAASIASMVHQISGSAAEFGAHRVLAVTREMERLARGAGVDAASALCPHLETALHEMKAAWMRLDALYQIPDQGEQLPR